MSAPPGRTALVDLKQGMVTPEWLRWFSELSAAEGTTAATVLQLTQAPPATPTGGATSLSGPIAWADLPVGAGVWNGTPTITGGVTVVPDPTAFNPFGAYRFARVMPVPPDPTDVYALYAFGTGNQRLILENTFVPATPVGVLANVESYVQLRATGWNGATGLARATTRLELVSGVTNQVDLYVGAATYQFRSTVLQSFDVADLGAAGVPWGTVYLKPGARMYRNDLTRWSNIGHDNQGAYWQISLNGDNFEWRDATGVVYQLMNNGDMWAGAHFYQFTERADPAAGAVNTFRLYAKDNGAGKTQAAIIFNTGAVQIIATQP
jgi:hypothetical protein